MQLTADGAQHCAEIFSSAALAELASHLAWTNPARPGTRLGSASGLATQVAPATELARTLLGPAARPVRATLFDKSPTRNWSLGWHQDRTIAVRDRRDVPGFTHWTIKTGIHHVTPPTDLLERMLTVRIHIDPVDADNAPLLVAPGSHRLGRIPEAELSGVVARLGSRACHAAPGDVWAYATLILHASAAAQQPRRRRVLQLLYSADELPGGLQWLGI